MRHTETETVYLHVSLAQGRPTSGSSGLGSSLVPLSVLYSTVLRYGTTSVPREDAESEYERTRSVLYSR